MRDLNDDEKNSIYRQCRCPFCGCYDFYEGPHGGISVNWYCAECLAGFNLAPPALRTAQLVRLPREQLSNVEPESPWARSAPREADLHTMFKKQTTLRAWFDMLRATPWGSDEHDPTD